MFIRLCLLATALALAGSVAWASAQSEIEAATERGEAVFVVVTETGHPATSRAVSVSAST